MAEYKLFCFIGSRLEWCEAFDAPDHLAAINNICGRATNQTLEIWQRDTKVAVLGPAKHSGGGSVPGGQTRRRRGA